MAPITATTPASLEVLLRRYRATGDPEALGLLFDATAPALFKVALAASPDAATAEDALQETYLAVIDAAAAYDPARPAWPWLLGILRNRVREARDRVRRVPDRARVAPPLAPPGPASEAEAREREERVRSALLSLPETYREVALLRWRYGLEPSEIAEVKGVPPGTIRSLLSRARERLRRTLAGLASLLVLWPGPEPRGLAAVRREILRRASRKVLAASVAAGGLMGGVLMAKKTVVAVAALLLLAGGVWILRPSPEEPEGGRGADMPTASGKTEGLLIPREEEKVPSSSTATADPPAPRETASVIVLVRDFDDRPAEGARVEVHPAIQPGITMPRAILELLDTRSSPAAFAVSDPQGRAELRGFAPGIMTVSASRDGLTRAARTLLLEAGPRGDPVLLRLGRGHSLEGRVLDPDGRPVPGACVVAGEEWGQVTRTDAEGAYAFGGLPWGNLMLRAARRGGLPVEVGGVEVPAVARFDIVLPGVAVLAGTVSDGETGTPLAGVRVEAMTWWGALGAGVATPDAAGKYAIDTIPPGTVNYVTAEKEGWLLPPPPPGPAGFRIALRPGETTVRDLRLVRAGRLEGVVSGPEGPLAGASVFAGVRKGEGARNRSATTDARGRYEFPIIEDGRVQVTAMMPGYQYPEWWKGVQGRDLSSCTVEVHPGETATHDIRLTRGATISGRVETVDGAPVEGARVGGSAVMGALCRSRADGTFDLTGPGPDVTEWVVRKEGFVEGLLRVPGEVDRTPEPLVVRLTRCPRVTGTVRSSSGDPLEEAHVKAFVVTGRQVRTPGGGAETLWSEPAPVGPDGTYEIALPSADSGQFRVYAYAPGHAGSSAAGDVTLVPGQEAYTFDIVLEPSRAIRGRVLRRGTGEPIPGARVKAGTVVGALTDAEGRFSVAAAAPAPPFLFSVWADGMVTVNARADTDAAETTVEMDPALNIRGVVVFPDGRPVPRVVVEARGPVTNRHSPGPDGVFGIEQLPPGEYTVVVMPYVNEPTWPFETAILEGVRSGTAGLRVVVQPVAGRPGRITGRVLGPDRSPLNGVLVLATGAGQRVQATTSSDGTFSLAGLEAGSFTVVANPPGSAIGPYAGGRGFAPATREEVEAGTGNLAFVLEAGLSLAGTLVDAGGRALPMVGLAAGGQVATTDAEGRFAFGGLGAGEHAIAVYPGSDGGVVLVQRNEKFVAGSTGIRLQAEAEKSVSVLGSVLDGKGSGVAGASVTVTAADGTRRSTVTRPDGTFRLGGLLPGTVILSATREGFEERSVEVEAGSGEEVRIVLPQEAR